MPVKKGTNNFFRYKREHIEFIKGRIDAYLERLRESKATFENVSQLATYLCARLTEDVLERWRKDGKNFNRPKPVAKSTLYRNEEYRAKLDSFIAGLDPKRGIDDRQATSSLPVAQAKITEQAIEISSLRARTQALERYIERMGNKPDPELEHSPLNHNEDQYAFEKTAQALRLVLEASEGQFVVRRGEIVATHKLVGNVVANALLVKPYLNWLEMQEAR